MYHLREYKKIKFQLIDLAWLLPAASSKFELIVKTIIIIQLKKKVNRFYLFYLI